MTQYLALLRGINVGGKNIIKMADLRDCLESLGLDDVSTYIQSGNVLFGSREKPAELRRRIEAALTGSFGYSATLALRSRRQLISIVERAPSGFGRRPAEYRYDVAFLNPPLTAPAARKRVVTRPGVDEAHAGTGVLYFSRLASQASRSRLGRIASLPIYASMTVRNWNTTTELLRRMRER